MPVTILLAELLADFNDARPWRRDAACRGMGTDLFFDVERAHEARKVCAGCVVLAQCGDAAMAANERGGVWGGMGERARDREQARRRLAEGGWLAVCERCAGPFPSSRRRGNFPRYCELCRPVVHAETVARSRRRREMEATG